MVISHINEVGPLRLIKRICNYVFLLFILILIIGPIDFKNESLLKSINVVDAFVDRMSTNGYRRCWGIYGSSGKRNTTITPDFAHLLKVSNEELNDVLNGDTPDTRDFYPIIQVRSPQSISNETGPLVVENTSNSREDGDFSIDQKLEAEAEAEPVPNQPTVPIPDPVPDPNPDVNEPNPNPLLPTRPKKKRYSVAIYDFNDEVSFLTDFETVELCGSEDTIKKGKCEEKDEGKFIIQTPKPPSNNYINEVVYVSVGESDPAETIFTVKDTGYYCALVIPTDYDRDTDGINNVVSIDIVQSIGLLPGIHYPKLIFYGVLMVVYGGLALAWSYQLYKYWHKILKLQIYIGGTLAYITFEMALNYGFLMNFNKTGKVNSALLIFSAASNAGRISLSFFLLLLVSLGYGVVRYTLGPNLFRKIILLTVIHFVFGVVYGLTTLMVQKYTLLLILVAIVPLSIAITVFYFWILNSIKLTRDHLKQNNQVIKLEMYDKLNRILMGSCVFIILFFILDILYFMDQASDFWWQKHWKSRWFMLDGWLNILYLLVFCSIAYLWRPNEKNERYGLQQLVNEDEYDSSDDLKDIVVGTRDDGEVLFDEEEYINNIGLKDIDRKPNKEQKGDLNSEDSKELDAITINNEEDNYLELDEDIQSGELAVWHKVVDDIDEDDDVVDLQRNHK